MALAACRANSGVRSWAMMSFAAPAISAVNSGDRKMGDSETPKIGWPFVPRIRVVHEAAAYFASVNCALKRARSPGTMLQSVERATQIRPASMQIGPRGKRPYSF